MFCRSNIDNPKLMSERIKTALLYFLGLSLIFGQTKSKMTIITPTVAKRESHFNFYAPLDIL